MFLLSKLFSYCATTRHVDDSSPAASSSSSTNTNGSAVVQNLLNSSTKCITDANKKPNALAKAVLLSLPQELMLHLLGFSDRASFLALVQTNKELKSYLTPRACLIHGIIKRVIVQNPEIGARERNEYFSKFYSSMLQDGINPFSHFCYYHIPDC